MDIFEDNGLFQDKPEYSDEVTAGFVQFYGTEVAKSPDTMIETIKDSHDLIRENVKMWQ